jgi:hypothetical protein
VDCTLFRNVPYARDKISELVAMPVVDWERGETGDLDARCETETRFPEGSSYVRIHDLTIQH